MRHEIKTGLYQHYKGGKYEVLGVAHHEETLEPLVVYKALYESKDFGTNALWVRPYNVFTEKILIDGKQIPRFTYIDTK
ncbi:MAG: DUF1653 domain-containing protein [Candidatus Paceibacterota bacterium]